MPVRGLTVLVLEASSERFRAALSIAAAHAALGGRARVFCHGAAVSVLRAPVRGAADERHETAGQPPLAILLDEAIGLGVAVIACQSGLDLATIDARLLDGRIAIDGLVGVMATLAGDRLVAV